MTDELCVIAGCSQPRYRIKSGRRYTRCEHHQKIYWKTRQSQSRATKPVPVVVQRHTKPAPGVCVKVIYPYFGEGGDELIVLEAKVVRTRPMPETEGELVEALMIAESEGYLIVQGEAL